MGWRNPNRKTDACNRQKESKVGAIFKAPPNQYYRLGDTKQLEYNTPLDFEQTQHRIAIS
jgi:hypothetical protein